MYWVSRLGTKHEACYGSQNQKLTAVGLDCTESKAKGLRHLTELTPWWLKSEKY